MDQDSVTLQYTDQGSVSTADQSAEVTCFEKDCLSTGRKNFPIGILTNTMFSAQSLYLKLRR